MMTDRDRLKLEQNILGSIIHRNSYQQIAHILTEKNFKDWDDHPHRLIFKTIAQCHPAINIDLVVISQILGQKNVDQVKLRIEYMGIENYVVLLVSKLSSSAGLPYLCNVLLEEDMRQKFMELLTKQAQVLDPGKADRMHVVEAYELLRDGEDLFKMKEKLPKYLEKVNYPPAMLKDINEFVAGIDNRIVEIKKLSQLDSIVNSLLSFAEVSEYDGPYEAIQVLTNSIKHIAFEEHVSPDIYKKIEELKALIS